MYVPSDLSTASACAESTEPLCNLEVLDGGTETTIQDYPGRLGYWAVGVPPSGPMDSLSFRLANRLLGNDEKAAGLEMVLPGPKLKFQQQAIICISGPSMPADLDGQPVPLWQPFLVSAGQTLVIGAAEGAGSRAYLAVAGGLAAPLELGSASTFLLGGFGGLAGRSLRTGDLLPFSALAATAPPRDSPLPPECRPQYREAWEIGVLYGPHGAPDYFTPRDVETFFATDWEVQREASRAGVRLAGPVPQWARPDGGEAGLHPSNLHDNAYAIGAIAFAGDQPIILGPDGPSLGGYVCPACIVRGELWKLGQLRTGDRVRFRALSEFEAADLLRAQESAIAHLEAQPVCSFIHAAPPGDAILARVQATPAAPELVCRAAGDANLLVECGPPELDLENRVRIHALMRWLEERRLPGAIDFTPGIRSLQIHYAPGQLSRADLLALIGEAGLEEAEPDEVEIPSRILHLPLSWDDPATQQAIEQYATGVRASAPWCPSNLDFIRRINGFESIERVREIVFAASYLVLALGHAHFGAPVAIPLDPRHRLVTAKCNPVRPWTPENAVGIGGAFLCVDGLEGPGGDQLIGRTLPMWNRVHTTPEFPPGRPWLLRNFDQIRFYPVSAPELLQMREDFPRGEFSPRIEQTTFQLREYRTFLKSIGKEAAECRVRQSAAFEEERDRWVSAGVDVVSTAPDFANGGAGTLTLPPGFQAARAPLPANVWQVLVQAGDKVAAGDRLVILEAMKTEIPVVAAAAGRVTEVLCGPGKLVAPGQALCLLTVHDAT